MEICNDIISRKLIAVMWVVNVTQVPAETLPLQSPTHSKDGTLHKFLFGLYVHKAWAKVTHSCSTCAEQSVFCCFCFALFHQCESECEDYSFITEQKLLQESRLCLDCFRCLQQTGLASERPNTERVHVLLLVTTHKTQCYCFLHIFLLNVNLSLCF